VSSVSAPTGKQLIAALKGLGFDVIRVKQGAVAGAGLAEPLQPA